MMLAASCALAWVGMLVVALLIGAPGLAYCAIAPGVAGWVCWKLYL